MVISLSKLRFTVFIIAAGVVTYYALLIAFATGSNTIKVGVLFSNTGPMRMSEEPVIKATLLAINEINERGGVLGMQIEPVIADGRSDLFIFAQHAERLISQEHVNVIFGCWLSASRKTVKPIVEKHNNLLIYPTHYEGLGTSENIVHTGGTFNQEILPVTLWAMNRFGKRMFLIGTESIFPRAVEQLLRQIIPQLGGEIVGSEYLKIGDERVEPIIEKISTTKPDIIINNIAGSTNIILYQKLADTWARGGKKIPVVAYHVKETDATLINPDHLAGTYLGGSFFQGVVNATSKKFLKRIGEVYGKNQAVSDVMAATYTGVHLWARAVEKARSTDTQKVTKALQELAYLAPEGMVATAHKAELDLYKWLRIANFTKNGQLTMLWQGKSVVTPQGHPGGMFIAQMMDFWPKEKWTEFLNRLYAHWGSKWAKE